MPVCLMSLYAAGTEEGYLYSLEVPSGVRYSSVKGHDRAVRDLAPVNASREGGLLTVSNDSISYRKAGGLTQFNLCGPQVSSSTVVSNSIALCTL